MTKPLSRLSDALFAAMQSGLPDVKILLDHYHLYIGGSPLSSLKYMNGANIGIVHVDDFSSNVNGAVLNDRVFPGEGIAQTHELAGLLHQIGYGGYLSLELFIEDYRGENALEVARRGLNSIKQAYNI